MSKKCRAYSVSKLGLEKPDNRKAFYAGWDAAIEQGLAVQPKQEPVAYAYFETENDSWPVFYSLAELARHWKPEILTPLYKAPQPQREWVGLTDEEIEDCWDGYLSDYQLQQIREISVKLREKNT